MSTNPNPCPLCGSTPRVGYDQVDCDNPYCPLVEVSFTADEWAKLTARSTRRARADRAVNALREVRRRCGLVLRATDNRRDATDTLCAIDTAVGKALEGLK